MDPTDGPHPEAITRYITQTFAETDLVSTDGATFFSLDSEKHWPNFATLVTSDGFDEASDLSRPGVFRLNIGVTRATFQRLVGDVEAPDFTALDQLLPHPIYARHNWLSIHNPSTRTFEEVVRPLLAEAHNQLVDRRRRRQGDG